MGKTNISDDQVVPIFVLGPRWHPSHDGLLGCAFLPGIWHSLATLVQQERLRRRAGERQAPSFVLSRQKAGQNAV